MRVDLLEFSDDKWTSHKRNIKMRTLLLQNLYNFQDGNDMPCQNMGIKLNCWPLFMLINGLHEDNDAAFKK